MSLIKFKVPLFLTRGKTKRKNYWLTLNNYRNWKYHLSNDLKIQFKDEIELPDLDEPIDIPVAVTFEFYYPDFRVRDVDGNLSVLSKFTLDAMVEAGLLIDDDYRYVRSVKGVYAGVDKAEPHCVVTVRESL